MTSRLNVTPNLQDAAVLYATSVAARETRPVQPANC